MITINLFAQYILRMVLGWNILAIQIQYTYISQDWLKITLLLANIGLDSFPKNPLHVYIESILLK